MNSSEDPRPPEAGQAETQTIRTRRSKRGPWHLLAFWILVVAILFLVGVVSRWLQ